MSMWKPAITSVYQINLRSRWRGIAFPWEKHHLALLILFSLVDGGGLRTFLCDPMHTLRSSGNTLSGIYIEHFLKFN